MYYSFPKPFAKIFFEKDSNVICKVKDSKFFILKALVTTFENEKVLCNIYSVNSHLG